MHCISSYKQSKIKYEVDLPPANFVRDEMQNRRLTVDGLSIHCITLIFIFLVKADLKSCVAVLPVANRNLTKNFAVKCNVQQIVGHNNSDDELHNCHLGSEYSI